MKKNISLLIGLALVFALSLDARAQQQPSNHVVPIPFVGAASNNVFPTMPSTSPVGSSQKSPLAVEDVYRYYSASNPWTDWVGFGNYGSIILLTPAERITLNSDSGFVDSVTVTLDTVTQDSVAVVLFPDTLYNTTLGPLYLINIYDQAAAPYGLAYIQASEVHGSTTITKAFPHVAVPKNFFVMLAPSTAANGTPTNAFYVRGDLEATRPRTTDNARSAWAGVLTSTGQKFAGIIDSTFVLNGQTTPAYSNLYITAYASSISAGVVSAEKQLSGLSLYPNPSNNTTVISMGERTHVTSLIVTDLLGRTVVDLSRSAQNSLRLTLNTSNLPAGIYQIVLSSSAGTETARLNVIH